MMKSKNLQCLLSMAIANLLRNKKKTIISVLSMMLAIILLNSVFTISRCMDLDKYVGHNINTSFLAASSDYFAQNFEGKSNSLDSAMVEGIKNTGLVKDGGLMYFNTDMENATIKTPDISDLYSDLEDNSTDIYKQDAQGNAFMQLYGIDDFITKKFEIVEGRVDLKKYATGNYLIYGVYKEGDKYVIPKLYNVGDKVSLLINGAEKEYEIMAIASQNYMLDTSRNEYSRISMYMSTNNYINEKLDKSIMSYRFDVEDENMDIMNSYLKNYTENEPNVEYISKDMIIKEFENMVKMVIVVGLVLSIIIATIAIINYINSLLADISIRRAEFALLQCTGMTNKQLQFMVFFEGAIYAVVSMFLSLFMSIILSLIGIKLIMDTLWFCTYKFTVLPLLYSYPLLIIIAILVPIIIFRDMKSNSIVERLNKAKN